MSSNPWRRDMRPGDHGKAVIHVSPDAGPIRFTRDHLVKLVSRKVLAGSIVFQVGIWSGAKERSAQVVLINGGHKGVLSWSSFKGLTEAIAASLCQELMQHAVMLELSSATKRYRARTYENNLGVAGVERQRRQAASRLRRRS